MGDLSWNPTSWTPSNLAEEAVEFISGSEAAGDVAGLAAAWLTGDMLGVAGQGMDLGTNILAGGSTLLEGFGKAAKDAVQNFSNPGSINSPSQDDYSYGGYGDGEATSSTDTGSFGTGGLSSTDGDINSILQGGGSLEDKIFAVLMLLQKEKKDQVEKKIGNLGNTQDKEKNLQELQKSTGELSQLTQLTTGLMNNFKQMKDSVIQNIR